MRKLKNKVKFAISSKSTISSKRPYLKFVSFNYYYYYYLLLWLKYKVTLTNSKEIGKRITNYLLIA